MQQQQAAEVITWKDRLRDSSWVTTAWDWFQNFLGRAAEPVLWCTMIYSCYGLIPGAPQAPASVSSFVFVAQFVALDVGGLGLNKLAQEQGLDRWSYTRVIAYILIAITLITITYAGIEHAVAIPKAVTAWVEAMLVIARSVMTILYAQAIHAMKVDRQHTRELIEAQQRQLESGQREVDSLRRQLDTKQQEVSTLQEQLKKVTTDLQTAHLQIADLQQTAGETAHLQENQHTLSAHLQTAHLQIADLTAQLEHATITIAELHHAERDVPVTSRSTRSVTQSSDMPNVTSIDQARAKHTAGSQGRMRVSHAEVIAFLDAHPTFKRAEVAEKLGISERKVYDAIAWQREQEQEHATSAQ